MRQQVNLYQPIFRRQTPLFSARTMLQSLLLMVAVLGGIYGYASHEVHMLATHVQGLERQRGDAETRLLALESSLPKREPSRLLASEVEKATGDIAERVALVAMLSSPGDASGHGFSTHLEGLARQNVEGLWLTGLRLRRAGRDIVIRGTALDAALVPVLVQRLSDEPAFAGMRFAALTIDRSDATPEQVDFELRTRLEDDEETQRER